MESITKPLIPSEDEALRAYRQYRDADRLPPLRTPPAPAKPSRAMNEAIHFTMALNEASTIDQDMDRLDAEHEAIALLTPDIRAALDLQLLRSAPDNPILRHTVTVGALLEEPDEPVRWTVADVMPAGGTSLLVAPPKAGKTTAARCLAVAVARGLTWLGRAL